MGDRSVIALVNEVNGRAKTIGHVVVEPDDLPRNFTLALVEKVSGKVWRARAWNQSEQREVIAILREEIGTGDSVGARRLVCFDQEIYLVYKV